MEYASKLLDHRRRQSSTFVSELPVSIDKVVREMADSDSDDEESTEGSNGEQRLGIHMHKMFYESVRHNQFSVVGELLRLKDTVGASEVDEYSISIALASKFDDLANRVCNFGRLPLDDDVRNAVVQVGAASAMAFVQLGRFISENHEGYDDFKTNSHRVSICRRILAIFEGIGSNQLQCSTKRKACWGVSADAILTQAAEHS